MEGCFSTVFHNTFNTFQVSFNGAAVVTKRGEDGLSAYEIAVKHGYIGTEAEWLISLQAQNCDPETDDAIIDVLIETDMLRAVTDSDGAILTDESGNILNM